MHPASGGGDGPADGQNLVTGMLVTRFVIVWAGGRSGRDTLLFDDDVGLWSLRTASQTPPCPSATNGRPPSPSPPPHDFLQPYTQSQRYERG